MTVLSFCKNRLLHLKRISESIVSKLLGLHQTPDSLLYAASLRQLLITSPRIHVSEAVLRTADSLSAPSGVILIVEQAT